MTVQQGGLVAAVFGLAALTMRGVTGLMATYKPNIAQPVSTDKRRPILEGDR